MGRIKTLPIKRVTKEIFSRFREKISGDYDKNKAFLKVTAEIRSKKIRNTIAGYLTRLAKAKEI